MWHQVLRNINDVCPCCIPMFDERDHPSVPTCLPRRVAADGGQRWPEATASAARSVVDGRPALRDAWRRRGSRLARFPLPLSAALQPTGSGSGKRIEILDCKAIKE